MAEIKFHCSGCGACCRNIKKVVEDAKLKVEAGDKTPLTIETAKFPFGYSVLGACEKLDSEGKCSVYENRPDICNVEKTHENFAKGVSKKKYFSMQNRFCNLLIRQAKMDNKFLVNEKY